jgi:hypothetical protein
MNNRDNQRAAAKQRKPTRAEVIRSVCHYLANTTDPTVTGATVVLPNGETIYVSADNARALHAREAPKGRRT